jgi:hypothetical protein
MTYLEPLTTYYITLRPFGVHALRVSPEEPVEATPEQVKRRDLALAQFDLAARQKGLYRIPKWLHDLVSRAIDIINGGHNTVERKIN